MHRTRDACRLPAHPSSARGLSQPAFLILLLTVAVLAGLGGFGVYHLTGPAEESQLARPEPPRSLNVIGSLRPVFSLPDLDGEMRHIGEWDGDVVLVNFWATWCPPCLKEMPAFVEVQDEYSDRGLTIVAVAIDAEQDVRDFSETYGLNFPVLLGQSGGMNVTREYGNRMGTLPYSVLLDRQGIIRFVKMGELHKETLVEEVLPLL